MNITKKEKISKHQLQCIKRYLQVYKMHANGMDLYDISKKLDPHYKIHKGYNSFRSWQRDLLNGKQINDNIKKGEFPGQYGEYKLKKLRDKKNNKKLIDLLNYYETA